MNRSSDLLKSGIKPRQSFLGFQSEAVWICLALAVLWFAICFRLGNLPLLQPDEGRNAEVAREMKESGAWLVPTYNGIAYLDKPAFYFKAVAISLCLLWRFRNGRAPALGGVGLASAGFDLPFLPAGIRRSLCGHGGHRDGDHAAFFGECADGDF